MPQQDQQNKLLQSLDAASFGCLLSGTAAGLMDKPGALSVMVLGATLMIFTGTLNMRGTHGPVDQKARSRDLARALNLEPGALVAETPSAAPAVSGGKGKRALATVFRAVRGGGRALFDGVLMPVARKTARNPLSVIAGGLATAFLIAGLQHCGTQDTQKAATPAGKAPSTAAP